MNPLPHLQLARAILTANLPHTHPRPYKLTFSVTNRCNAHCRHCNIWRKTEPSDPLTLEEIDRLVSRYPYLSWIDLTGGEPLLKPDLPELVAILLRRLP
ncbi:MAG: radical SAM protein, partial [Magnetococcales bacterium]|nr:radical SAM protein [Magnetococcales bacterium]